MYGTIEVVKKAWLDPMELGLKYPQENMIDKADGMEDRALETDLVFQHETGVCRYYLQKMRLTQTPFKIVNYGTTRIVRFVPGVQTIKFI